MNINFDSLFAAKKDSGIDHYTPQRKQKGSEGVQRETK